jgi:hypothetical protein
MKIFDVRDRYGGIGQGLYILTKYSGRVSHIWCLAPQLPRTSSSLVLTDAHAYFRLLHLPGK